MGDSSGTFCPKCSKRFFINDNRLHRIHDRTFFIWFYDAIKQFENYSKVKCPFCDTTFIAPEARLFGVFKSPVTVVILSGLVVLLIFVCLYFYEIRN